MQYQTRYQAPYPTNDAGTLIYKPASGTELVFSVPDIDVNTTYDFDVTTLVQEIVHGPWYDGTVPMAFCIGPTQNTTVGEERNIVPRENPDDSKQAELMITFRETRRMQVV